VVVKQHIGKFLFWIGNVVDTYQAFPYFTSPDHAFESYIGELARFFRQHDVDSRQARAIADTMQKAIDFISLSVPSTAVEKSRFIDILAKERDKVLRVMETEALNKMKAC
jgi:hypothetical protein